MRKDIQEITELTRQLNDLRVEFWLHNTLFTFNWRVLLLTTVIAFIVWVIIVDKKSIVEIVTYGLMIMITGTMLDVLGVSIVLWIYPHTLIPLPIFSMVHIVQMPIIYMVIYQYFDKWKPFLIAMIINAFLFAFVLEPLLRWLQSYKQYHWEHIYSFLPYIIIGVVFKWLINKFKQLDKHYDNK